MHLAGDFAGVGRSFAEQKQYGAAVDGMRSATAILEELFAANPNNATLRNYLGDSYQLLGADLKDDGKLDAGVRYLRKAQDIYQSLAVSDSSNVRLWHHLGYTDLWIGDTLAKQGNYSAGVRSLQDSLTIFGRLVQAHPDNRWNREGLVRAYAALGDAYQLWANDGHLSKRERLADSIKARDNYRESLDGFSELQAHGALSVDLEQERSRVQQAMGGSH